MCSAPSLCVIALAALGARGASPEILLGHWIVPDENCEGEPHLRGKRTTKCAAWLRAPGMGVRVGRTLGIVGSPVVRISCAQNRTQQGVG